MLKIEMIPKNTWGMNVRKVVSYDTWQDLRFQFGAFDDLCRLCGRSGCYPLELHEEWHYDDNARVQILAGLIPICAQCHSVIHFGRSVKVGEAEQALEHLQKINDWNEADVEAHVKEAVALWEERSQFRYSVDISLLFGVLSKKRIHLDWAHEDRQVYRGRFDAIQWARNVICDPDVLILDTETTGLPQKKKNVEVIQIGAVDTDGEVIIDELVKPKFKIPQRTTKIHGITNEDVELMPSFRDVHSALQEAIEGKTVISYKVAFEREVLARTCAIHGVPELKPKKWLCALKAYRAYKDFPKHCSMPGAKHTAVEDCYVLLDLLMSMARTPDR